VMVAAFVAVTVMGAEHRDQADQIRDLRNTIQHSLRPTAQLNADAPDGGTPLEFMGRPCSEDCSGHIAGWEWAAKRGAVRTAQCEVAKSPSFAEGCRIYLWRMGYGPEPQ
jgi:hypothetical protein